MLIHRPLIALAALALASPASAQNIPAFALSPGEAIEFRGDDGGVIGSPRRHAAEWSAYDLVAARQLAGSPTPDAPVPNPTPIDSAAERVATPIARNELHARLLSIAGRHTLLVIENGFDHALVYRATMTRNGQSRPTDVCVIMPGQRGYEHWPHPIERLELSDFRLVIWPPGRPQTCQ